MGPGGLALPTPVHPQAASSVELGNFKSASGPVCSEQKQAYGPQGLPSHRYTGSVAFHQDGAKGSQGHTGVPPKAPGPVLCL